jgi:hypothetical protein
MSTTDQRTGFRLPWSTEGRARDSETDPELMDGESPDASADADATAEAVDAPATDAEPGEEGATMAWPEVDRRIRQIGRRAGDRADAALADITAGAPPAPRKTNALMAGLSKAMHAAAEGARAETLERLAGDAAARTESIKAAAADEATAIKQAADDDIAGIREWSKNELARIREETEAKITARRESLEHETSAHAARVEARIERVKRLVATFEATMAEFFEMLLAETDPARVALLAEQLPEAPSLEVDDELEAAVEAFEAAAFEAAESADVAETADVADTVDASDAALDVATAEPVEGPLEVVMADAPAATDAVEDAGAEAAPEPAFDAEVAAAAAEAEALAAASNASPDDEATAQSTALSEEALAARLARMEHADADAGTSQTELIVTGLISVAGIAGFKRAITRIPGVSSVGVTSGPGGEFVYSVSHAAETDFRAAIAGLSEFSAHITGEAEGSFQVTAADSNPESN